MTTAALMPRRPCHARALGLTAAAALCVGCGTSHRAAAENTDGSAPVRGGTLRIVSNADVDHLWPASASTGLSYDLVSTFHRQLFAYPSSADYATATTVAPDLAAEVPTRANGGISTDGRTIVVHMRSGARWNSTPPRQVTARDVERAFKLFCNPVSPVAGLTYYQATIRGLREYCEPFQRVPPTVTAIRRYASSHEIEGVRVLDELTLAFGLRAPASDFLDILAMTYASPVPEEYLQYLPDSPSFRQHTLSNGPYAIARYEPNRRYELVRNPAWEPAHDPIRPAWVERIAVQLAVDDELGQLEIEAGTADLPTSVMLTANSAALRTRRDERAILMPAGDHYTEMFALRINVMGANNRSALRRLPVRRALALAVDRRALVQLAGGSIIARALYQSVPSTVSGFRPGADQNVTADDRGDPAAARHLLADAGFPAGLSLRLAYLNQGLVPLLAQSVQAGLRRAGIEVTLAPYTPSELFGQILADSNHAKRGDWDLVLWPVPADWYSRNNGRAFIGVNFDGRVFGDPGGYDSPAVNAAIDRAVMAPNAEEAEDAWEEAATLVMADVAVVPLIEAKDVRMRGARVRNCVWYVTTFQCNWNAVWLADAGAARRK